MNEKPTCGTCEEELGVMGQLPDVAFPATVDSATVFACFNEDCPRYLLLTCG